MAELLLVLEVSCALTSELNLEHLVDLVVDSLTRHFKAEEASLMLLEPDSGILSIKAARGLSLEIIEETRVKLGEDIAGWVAKHGEAVLLAKGQRDPRFSKVMKRDNIVSAISVPLKFKDKIVGVLNLNNIGRKDVFNEEDVAFLSILADITAVAVENAQLYERARQHYRSTIASLSAAIDAKDPHTRGHSENVTKYALAIAQELGMSEIEKEVLETAALLHDIGKIGIPESTLTKQDELSAQEYELIKTHPLTGIQIIKPIEMFTPVTSIISSHHERYDGNGYARGLQGEDIPLGARILAVADAFEAMTAERPYRSALSFEKAVAELKKGAGTQFDPKVVNTFLKVLKKH
jgi:putative nucleotidyltransferase with HDIG domain